MALNPAKRGALRAMSLMMTAVTVGVIALVALAPSASATHAYTTCSPGGVVCVVQSNSPYAGPACNAYGYNYGHNADFNEVRVNAGGASATAGGQNACDNWYYNDADYGGLYAKSTVAGKSVNMGWYRISNWDGHWPGAPADFYGEYIVLVVNDGSGNTGIRWEHRVTPSAGTDTCATTLYVQGTATPLPCPAGNPPAPPALPWGSLPH